MNRRFKNALYINFRNLFFSEAVKAATIITFLLACFFSFLPWFSRVLFGENNVQQIQNNFLITMGICLIFLLFIVMLITRIGAQVGFEKGSKVTELILTSISRRQLYMSHVFSGFIVVVLALSIVYSPIFLANCIHDDAIAVTISGVSLSTWIFIFVHAIGTCFVMVILAIVVTSIVKRSEDTGPYLLMVLVPFFISNIYFVIKGDIYQGIWSVFNYIPICSLLPATGVCMLGKLDGTIKVLMILSDFVWIFIVFMLGERCFKKNIASM